MVLNILVLLVNVVMLCDVIELGRLFVNRRKSIELRIEFGGIFEVIGRLVEIFRNGDMLVLIWIIVRCFCRNYICVIY